MMGLLVGRMLVMGAAVMTKMTFRARFQDGPCPYGIHVNIDSP
jgi:hypothetical protein